MTDEVFTRALDRDMPAMRPGFRDDLLALFDAPTTASPAASLTTTDPPLSKRRWLVPVSVAASIAAIIGVGVITTRPDSDPSSPGPATVSESMSVTTGTSPLPEAAVTSSTSPLDVELVLRGDGLGTVRFGTPQREVIRVVQHALGALDYEIGTPGGVSTPGASGCANKSQTVVAFTGLVLGFTDSGDGPLFDAWASSGPLATAEGLAARDPLKVYRSVYGDRAVQEQQHDGWEWIRFETAPSLVDTPSGQLVLQQGGFAKVTAGTRCVADPTQPPPTTQPPPDGDYITLDMSVPNPSFEVEPRSLTSFATNGRILAIAGPDLFAVIDANAGTIEYYDPRSGLAIRHVPMEQVGENIAWAAFGPDDVLYTYEGDGAGQDNPDTSDMAFVARGLRNGRYDAIASVEHAIGDVGFGFEATGIFASERTNIVLPYVDRDGDPSGAIHPVPVIDSAIDGQTLTVRKGDRSWTIYYLHGDCYNEGFSNCNNPRQGPGDSVVLVDFFPSFEEPRQRVTLLGDTVISMDLPWQYVGPIGKDLLVSRRVDDRTDVAIIEL
jgi:hypothetical protein